MRVAIVGPESSGTRLMTRIMNNSGASTLHRSFPYHGGEARHWPEASVRQFNPDAMIWMTRDWWATTASQLAAGHEVDPSVSWSNCLEATQRLSELSKEYRTFMVSYESLIQRPKVVVANLVHELGLKVPNLEPIVDGNKKYLG